MLSEQIMLILSEKQVEGLIDIDELIAALERAHIQYSTGNAVMPVRLVVPLPQIDGRITSMPGFLNEDQALGMKVVTYFHNNPKQNLPSILATIMLFSAESGKMIAVMDGSYITAIRTACASAMASKVLSNPSASELGILGAGVQAKAHITALARVRKIRRIKIYSPSGTSAGRVKQEVESHVGVAIEVVNSAEEAVRGADLIVTATTAKQPILAAEWLKPEKLVSIGIRPALPNDFAHRSALIEREIQLDRRCNSPQDHLGFICTDLLPLGASRGEEACWQRQGPFDGGPELSRTNKIRRRPVLRDRKQAE